MWSEDGLRSDAVIQLLSEITFLLILGINGIVLWCSPATLAHFTQKASIQTFCILSHGVLQSKPSLKSFFLMLLSSKHIRKIHFALKYIWVSNNEMTGMLMWKYCI